MSAVAPTRLGRYTGCAKRNGLDPFVWLRDALTGVRLLRASQCFSSSIAPGCE